MQDRDIVVVRDIQSEFPVGAIPNGSVSSDLRHLHEYAALSANIYENEESRIPIPGWELLYRPSLPEKPHWHLKISGFGCEVWCKKRPESDHTAVVVFRGTDVKQVGDWFSNFRWITRFIPLTWDQYEQTRMLVPAIVERIRREVGENATIVATGHSLGGGLAQQAAYASQHIKLVYAFDPSTVTGYYDVPRRERNANCTDMRIYRVYEHGEVLAYLRLIFKALYPVSTRRPKIVEIRYNLTSDTPFGQHSMKALALALAGIAGRQSGADKGVSSELASKSS